jgi:hypothetical protein
LVLYTIRKPKVQDFRKISKLEESDPLLHKIMLDHETAKDYLKKRISQKNLKEPFFVHFQKKHFSFL